MGKPDKGNVKLTAIILVPQAVPPAYISDTVNDTNEEQDEKRLAHTAAIDKRDRELEAISALHLGEAELIQEVND